MSKKIAPTLQAFARVCDTHCLMLHEVEPLRRELRALLAVARAAEAVRLWSRPVEMQRSAFLSEEHAHLNVRTPSDARLHRALMRLDRVSSRPSTVEGNRKPASNSSRPGRGRTT